MKKLLLAFSLLVLTVFAAVLPANAASNKVDAWKLSLPTYQAIAPNGVHSWKATLPIVSNNAYGRALGYTDAEIAEFQELSAAVASGRAKPNTIYTLKSGRKGWAVHFVASPDKTFYTKMLFKNGSHDNVIPSYQNCGVWGLQIILPNRNVIGYHILEQCGNPARPATVPVPTELIINKETYIPTKFFIDRPVFVDNTIEVETVHNVEVPVWCEVTVEKEKVVKEFIDRFVPVLYVSPNQPRYRQYTEIGDAKITPWESQGFFGGVLKAWVGRTRIGSTNISQTGGGAFQIQGQSSNQNQVNNQNMVNNQNTDVNQALDNQIGVVANGGDGGNAEAGAAASSSSSSASSG